MKSRLNTPSGFCACVSLSHSAAIAALTIPTAGNDYQATQKLILKIFLVWTAVMIPVADDLTNRCSERKEKMKEGKLLTQADKEVRKEL